MARLPPPLYQQFPLHSAILEVLEEGEEFHPRKLGEATTKSIYRSRTNDILPPPKVQEKYPNVDYQQLVYPRLSYKILEPKSKDIQFSIVHGLV